MDAGEPRPRHRGLFLHSTDEPDTGEHENPEGFVVRVRFNRGTSTRHSIRFSSRRQVHFRAADSSSSTSQPAIRSGSVTGSRQRAHLPR